jgi:hypothetical protein
MVDAMAVFLQDGTALLPTIYMGSLSVTEEPNDYDVFLETWKPSERLLYAELSQNQADPIAQDRLLMDSTGAAPLERTAYAPGLKVMDDKERRARLYSFFQERQDKWAAEFRDYLLSYEIPNEKIDAYEVGFAQHWVDGLKRRQDSVEMLAIKASVRDHDRAFHTKLAEQFVINSVDPAVQPLFTPEEMMIVFEANRGLIDAFLPDYVDQLGATFVETISDLYVRRGVYMPEIGSVRRELHYLSSYSLALGPVEQFAQTYPPAARGIGVASLL